MADRRPEFLPAPDLTILLDIAPETAVKRKAAKRDRYERDLSLLSRVRESYRRQAAASGLVAHRRRTADAALVRGGGSRRTGDTARATVSARTSRAPAAAASARTLRASHRSCSRRPPARRRARGPAAAVASANAPRTLACRFAAGRSACDAGRSWYGATRGPPERPVRAPARGLVESAHQPPRPDAAAPAPTTSAPSRTSSPRARIIRRELCAPAIGCRRTSARGRSRGAVLRSCPWQPCVRSPA